MTQSQLYFGWQINMKHVKDSVRDALDRYYKKFGLPPQLVLVSDQLNEPLDLTLIVRAQRMPKNILLIGRYYEQVQENGQDEIQNSETSRPSHDANLES